MAQRITAMSPAPYAREALPMASAQRGLSGMNPPNAGMTNQDDAGAASKPYVNHQPTQQMGLAEQNVRQNVQSAAPQAAANAMGQVRKMSTEESSAQNFMNQKMANVIDDQLEAQGGGRALMQLNAVLQSPQREAFVNDIATTRAMFQGAAPELGQVTAEANRYR